MSSLLKEIISWIQPEVCFRCNKCVSGCPIARIIDEYRPNRIVKMAYYGQIKELIESELIWYCTQCFTCTERCPMEVAPADVIVALRNVASRENKAHIAWVKMAQNIMRIGAILPEMGVVRRDRKLVKRSDLGITIFRVTESGKLIRLFKKSGSPIVMGDK
ncbi:MAG: 4Fe-4S dicluster domain-containing protein [Candidatus Njordarchaeota archaeon]